MSPLALYDLDNTLLDRDAAFRRWAEGFARARDFPDESVEDLVELDADGLRSRSDLFDQVRVRFRLDDGLEALIDAYHRDYPIHFDFPEASRAGLRALRSAGWKVGIVTNGHQFQERKLEVARLVEEVDGICISGLVDSWKPDPVIFVEAARRCGTALEGWMVGDSGPADIRGGQGVGLRTIWLARGRRWELGDPAPDARTETVAGAVGIILGDGPPW